MEAVYKLAIEELDINLLESLKLAFQGKQVEITVREAKQDETEYLLATEANRRQLEEAMDALAAGKGIEFTKEMQKEFEQKIAEKLADEAKKNVA